MKHSNKTFLVVSLATLGALISLAAWAFASPVGSSPDEPYHLASIWCAQGDRDSVCITSKESINVEVPANLITSSSCFAFQADKSANCQKASDSAMATTRSSNRDGGYPPFFYYTMSFMASSNLVLSVLIMRIFNLVLFVLLVGATAYFLEPALRRAMLTASLISLVPLGMFLIASVNPSSWAVISASVLLFSSLGFLESQDKRKRIGLGVCSTIAVIIGAGARSDSAIYSCLIIALAALISLKSKIHSKNKKQDLPKYLFPITLALFSVVLFFQGRQSNIVNPSSALTNGNNPREILHLLIENFTLLPSLWVGPFGTWGLGWLDTVMPPVVWCSVLIVFIGVTFQGIKYLNRSKLIALICVVLFLIAIPMYILVHDRILVGSGVQPRYIYPLLIVFAGVAVFQPRNIELFNSLGSVQVWASATLISVANSVALYTNIRRYITGTDITTVNLNLNVEWWWDFPISPMSTWLLGSLSAGLVIFVLAYIYLKTQPIIMKNYLEDSSLRR